MAALLYKVEILLRLKIMTNCNTKEGKLLYNISFYSPFLLQILKSFERRNKIFPRFSNTFHHCNYIPKLIFFKCVQTNLPPL